MAGEHLIWRAVVRRRCPGRLGPHDPPPDGPVGRTDIAQQVHALALRAYDQINGSPRLPRRWLLRRVDTRRAGDPDIRRISMLLCFVKRLRDFYLRHFRGFLQRGWIHGLGCCGQDREGPLAVEGKLL